MHVLIILIITLALIYNTNTHICIYSYTDPSSSAEAGVVYGTIHLIPRRGRATLWCSVSGAILHHVCTVVTSG